MSTREEYHEMKGDKTYGKDDCPLCQVLQNNEKHILWRGKKWFILHNIYSYSGEENHIMLVPYEHKKFSYELTTEETAEMADAYKFIKDFYADGKYFSATRETMDNRSIEHFHTHFLPGRLQGKYIRNMLMNQGFPVVQHLD